MTVLISTLWPAASRSCARRAYLGGAAIAPKPSVSPKAKWLAQDKSLFTDKASWQITLSLCLQSKAARGRMLECGKAFVIDQMATIEEAVYPSAADSSPQRIRIASSTRYAHCAHHPAASCRTGLSAGLRTLDVVEAYVDTERSNRLAVWHKNRKRGMRLSLAIVMLAALTLSASAGAFAILLLWLLHTSVSV